MISRGGDPGGHAGPIGLLLPTALATGVLGAAAFVLALAVPGRAVLWLLLPVVLLAGIVGWGVHVLLARNAELVAMREVSEALILSQERNRFAQDLHDILGHSLTVLAVKSELASRLLDIDVDRARIEVEDLERLSRDALADVRRAVHGYKDLSLPSEITRARLALESAGIEAELPTSADVVEGDLRELFAWTIREGVTNVIRHSDATSCRVELFADRIVVSDDGRGPEGPTHLGHGLSGLEDRAAAAGAALRTWKMEPTGFALEVTSKR